MADPRKVRAQKILYLLAQKGLTCSAIDRDNPDFYAGQARSALHEPNEAAEKAIAEALGMTPQELWPERFNPIGTRFLPQPRENYMRRPSKATSQNDATQQLSDGDRLTCNASS